MVKSGMNGTDGRCKIGEYIVRIFEVMGREVLLCDFHAHIISTEVT